MGTVFFEDVAIFDGVAPRLLEGMDVLVEGERIARIGTGLQAPGGATRLPGKGRVLMPGLIDAHWHSLFATLPVSEVLSSDVAFLNFKAAKANRDALLRGFTSVRDVGGNVFGLKRATDAGLIEGPRIYPSGAYISQTGGHGDFRGPNDVPLNEAAPLDYHQRVGMTLIADGVPEVMRRVREVLRMGASQVKVMAGGGVSSLYDPLDVTQYTFEEMKAAVEVARNWNTYVAVHANTDAAVHQALEAGVLSIEHGFLMEAETVALMAEKGAWFSMQPLMNDEDALTFENPVSTAKYEAVVDGLDRVVHLARAHHVPTAFGTDTLFDPAAADRQGKLLSKLVRWYTPHEALKMATHDNAQLLKLCGPRDPYPGALGVVQEGAWADLVLVDGDPLMDLGLVADPRRNFLAILKGGRIHKNLLA